MILIYLLHINPLEKVKLSPIFLMILLKLKFRSMKLTKIST